MKHTKSSLAWGLEIANQLFFYASPAIFDFGQLLVNFADDYCGSDYKKATLISIIVAFNVGWFVPNIFYGILYVIQHPFFEQYRCQDWVWNQPHSARRTKYMEVLKSTVFTFLINQVIMTTLIYYIGIKAMAHTDDQAYIREWILDRPSILASFGKILLGLLIFETTFYWSHVWLHTPMGYRFHKDHHAYYTPMSLTGQWGSFVDGLVSLPLPSFVPVLVLSLHPTTVWLYAIIHTAHSSYDHCGYDFPFNPFQFIPLGSHGEAHNFHHSHSVDNFGLYWRFWDIIMGTDKKWNEYCAKRDAFLVKLKGGENVDNDEDFMVKDGIILLKCEAEKRHIAEGTDNLEFTFQSTYKHIDENGNVVVGLAAKEEPKKAK